MVYKGGPTLYNMHTYKYPTTITVSREEIKLYTYIHTYRNMFEKQKYHNISVKHLN